MNRVQSNKKHSALGQRALGTGYQLIRRRGQYTGWYPREGVFDVRNSDSDIIVWPNDSFTAAANGYNVRLCASKKENDTHDGRESVRRRRKAECLWLVERRRCVPLT